PRYRLDEAIDWFDHEAFLGDDLDPDAMPPLEDRPFGSPDQVDVSPTEARKLVEQVLDRWEAEGRVFKPHELYLVCADQVGRSRSWFRDLVRKHEESGRLEYVDRLEGTYRVAPRPSANEATGT